MIQAVKPFDYTIKGPTPYDSFVAGRSRALQEDVTERKMGLAETASGQSQQRLDIAQSEEERRQGAFTTESRYMDMYNPLSQMQGMSYDQQTEYAKKRLVDLQERGVPSQDTEEYINLDEAGRKQAWDNIRQIGEAKGFIAAPTAKVSDRLMEVYNPNTGVNEFVPSSVLRSATPGTYEGARVSSQTKLGQEIATGKTDVKKTAAQLKFERQQETNINKEEMKRYSDEAEQSAKYKPTIRNVNKIISLSKKVETGQLSGLIPVVYLRKLMGDNELQELEARIKGLPLPVLKKTFGAAFSVSEGETLAQSLANIQMDGPAFLAAMNKMKSELEYGENVFQAKRKHVKKTRGNLVDFDESSIPYPVYNGDSGQSLSGQDQQALDWANANPNDPRAAQIKQKLGAQ